MKRLCWLACALAILHGACEAKPLRVQGSRVASGSVTVTWQPTLYDGDNTPVKSLASYTVKCGTTSGTYTVSNNIAVGSLTTTSNWLGITTYTYTTTSLASGTWYCAITSTDAGGNESDASNEISKVVP